MMTMGEDIPSLQVFARRSAQGAPAYAILFQLAVANLMLLTRSFEACWISFSSRCVLLVLTVLRRHPLRITQPDALGPTAPGDTGKPLWFSARDRLHDVLSVDGAAVAVISRCIDHGFAC